MDKNNNDLFELMTKMYNEIQGMKQDINKRFDGMENRLENVENRLTNVENEVQKINISIENDIKPSISALLDGYKQNSEQITRIENRLNEHDEIIIKRVK